MEVVNAAHTRQSRPEDSEEEEEEEEDTWVFPLVQMKPLGIQVDEQVTQVRLRPRPCDERGLVWSAVSHLHPRLFILKTFDVQDSLHLWLPSLMIHSSNSVFIMGCFRIINHRVPNRP